MKPFPSFSSLTVAYNEARQMFADLNQYAIRPTKSIGILYDLRSPLAQLARSLVDDVPVFRVLTETERTSISNRSLKLFTLSGIYQGTKALLSRGRADQLSQDDKAFAAAYWTAVSTQIPEWLLASTRKVTTAELRREYVHSPRPSTACFGTNGFVAPKRRADVMEKTPCCFEGY